MNKYIYALCFIFTVFGQDAFESISFELSLNSKTFSSEFNNYYKQNDGLNFRISSPYHLGDFYAGIKQVNYISKVKENDEISSSDFNSYFIYLGWQYSLLKSEKFRAHIAFHLGSFEMKFPSESRWYYASESELSTALELNLSYEIMTDVNLLLASEYQHVYTFKAIKIHSYNLGLSFKYEMPECLKQFLQ